MKRTIRLLVVLLVLGGSSANAWEVIRIADSTGVDGWVVLARPADYHKGGWAHSEPEIVIRWDPEWGFDLFLNTGGPSAVADMTVYLQLGSGGELKAMVGDVSVNEMAVFVPRSDVRGFVDEMAILEEDDFITFIVGLRGKERLIASFSMDGFGSALEEWESAQ